MKYYSQLGQDYFLDTEVFFGKKNGKFVDVGAADGLLHSNTFFFEKERSWQGICIEPRIDDYIKLKKNRKCNSVNAAVASANEIREFLNICGPSSQLSGLLDAYDNRHLHRINNELVQNDSTKIIKSVKCIRLDEILEKYKFYDIDYCSLDTEGNEEDVIRSINFNKFKIRYFTIENNYSSESLRELMKSRGYRLIKKLRVDDVYEFVGLPKASYCSSLAGKVRYYFNNIGFNYHPGVDRSYLDQKKLVNTNKATVFDIGANIGQSTRKYRDIIPNAEIYAFEPDPELYSICFDNLKNDARSNVYKLAVSSDNGNAILYQNKYKATNSLLKPLSKSKRIFKDLNDQLKTTGYISVRTVSVDAFCHKHNIKKIDILKLDIQGNELHALIGAKKILKRGMVDIVYCEVEFSRIYKDQPLFIEIITFLLSMNYGIYNIYNQELSENGQVISADIIFVLNKRLK